jgi:benzoylformate decarboxylase
MGGVLRMATQISDSKETRPEPSRTGRDVVYDYLRDVGVRYVFGVPGTNEVPLIDGRSPSGHVKPKDGSSPDPAPGEVDYVPCLHENIAVGAAMGYARGSGVPGVVELHITPGAAHGIGNLYNAYKAHVPIVVLCVQQHRDLLLQEPLLESDLVQIARQFTKWSYEVRTTGDLPLALQRAFKVAMTPSTQPVFLSIPWDITIEHVTPVTEHITPVKDPSPERHGLVTRIKHEYVGDMTGLQELAEALVDTSKSPLIVAGDGVGAARAWTELETLAKLVGATVYSASHSSMMNFPNSSPRWQAELPSTQKGMRTVFGAHDVAFLCGYNSQAPVLVFNHEDGPLIPAAVKQLYLHNDPWEIGKNGYGHVAVLGDIKLSLQAISDAVPAAIMKHPGSADRIKTSESEIARLGAERDKRVAEFRAKLREPNQTRRIIGADIADVLYRCLHKRPFTLVNEAVSDAPVFRKLLDYHEPKDYFFGSGGSLGFSMPASIGFSLAYAAAGDKRLVINVVGDGSALFYPQSWWTATHKDPGSTKQPVPPISILTIVVNNRQYRTLLKGVDALKDVLQWTPSTDTEYLHLEEDAVDYVALASAFGVGGRRVETLADLEPAVKCGIDMVRKTPATPYVLDVLTDPISHEDDSDPWQVPRFYTLMGEICRDEGFDFSAFDYVGPP